MPPIWISPDLFPTAKVPQLRILAQGVQKLAGGGETVHRLGHESARHGMTILGRAPHLAPRNRQEARQGAQFQHRHQPLRGGTERASALLQNGEELRLQKVGELRELLAESKLHGGLRSLRFVSQQQLISNGALFQTKSGRFVLLQCLR